MPFVKIGEHRARTENLLYYYKGSSGYTLVYMIDAVEKFVTIPITAESDAGIKVLDTVLKVLGQ